MQKAAWLCVAAGAGLLAGNLGRRLTTAVPEPSSPPTSVTASSKGNAKAITPFASPAWSVRDGSGPAEMLALPAGAQRTSEMALWLGSADAVGIAALYADLIKEQPEDGTLLDLLMTRWMALDPHGALAVVSGKDLGERRAWLSWGMVNPEAAMKEAKARNSGYVWWIARGAAYTNPQLAMRLMDEYPGMRFPGIDDILRMGLQDQGWREAIEFSYSSATLRSWAKEEPEKALEWALANLRKVESDYQASSGFWRGLIGDMEESDVKEAIAALPPGKIRADLETALLKRLIDRDVDAALLLANSAEKGPARARMFAEIGMALAVRDPARSLETLREFFADGSGKTVTGLLSPGEGMPTPMYPDEIGRWVSRLAEQDPVQVIEMAGPEYSREISGSWQQRDFDGYYKWVDQLPSTEANDQHFGRIAEHFRKDPAQSMEVYSHVFTWLEKFSNEDSRLNAMYNTIQEWSRSNPGAVEEYFKEGGAAPATQREYYQRLKKEVP